MHRYFVSEVHENENYTAGVVNKHVEEWLMSWGYKPLRYPFIKRNNGWVKVIRMIQTVYWSITLPKDTIVIFHFPVVPRVYQWLLKLLYRKGIYTVALVHDIEGLRFEDEYTLKKEKFLLSFFKHVIVHNAAMRNYLKSDIPKSTMSELWLFDYKTAGTYFKPRVLTPSITLVANLNKASYVSLLPDWAASYPNLQIYIYGALPQNHEVKKTYNVHFLGAVEPEQLPEAIEGSFGIVWDGDSITDCTNSLGNYLQFNTPHKLSMYLSAGMPVIVWRKSAMAEWVQQKEVGMAVTSWTEAVETIKMLNENTYRKWQSNAQEIGNKLRSGYFLKSILSEIENQKDRN
ncbi:MAG: hypothetical protein C4330_00920 [Chitinophagaceae bacterium]